MNKKYILFYDSGVGGLTTLAETLKVTNGQNFIYFADDINCPYGNKKSEDIYMLIKNNILALKEKYIIETIVIACNTATACAVAKLRREFKDISIIGIEPAIKLAMAESVSKHIFVIATPGTLKQEKFKALLKSSTGEIECVKMPCLAEKIERHFSFGDSLEIGDEIKRIKNILLLFTDIDCIVLGCTHYSLIKSQISDLGIKIFDGNTGVAKHVKGVLYEDDIKGKNHVKIILKSSDTDKKEKYKKLLVDLISKKR